MIVLLKPLLAAFFSQLDGTGQKLNCDVFFNTGISNKQTITNYRAYIINI